MKPGLHIMDEATYHADPCPAPSLSSSIAKVLVTQSPLHAWTAHPRLNPNHEPTEKTAFDLGSAAHALLLEGEDRMQVISAKDYRTKAAQEERDAARTIGKHPVLERQYADVLKMREIALQAIADCPDLSGLTLAGGTAEQVMIWQEAGGIWCRARPDWMSHDRKIQLSYKSTAASANPVDWVRTGLGIGADLQDAYYLRGNRATGGPEDGVSVILCQENEPPYACALMGLDPAFLALANDKVEEAIGIWRQCITTGKWPAYPPRIHWLQPPAYAAAQWMERTGREVDDTPRGTFADPAKLFERKLDIGSV